MDKMKLVLVALVAVLSALVLILGTAFLLVHVRKYLREKRFASREIPDFNTAGSFTLSELLNDKNITVIPWERLEIQKRLGVGASGSVSLASMQRSPSAPVEEVAVKELHGIFDPTEELVQEFVHEVSIAAALHHPNVVQFIGVARKGELELALITEVMERGSLAELLNKKKHNLPWKLRLKLVRSKSNVAMVFTNPRTGPRRCKGHGISTQVQSDTQGLKARYVVHKRTSAYRSQTNRQPAGEQEVGVQGVRLWHFEGKPEARADHDGSRHPCVRLCCVFPLQSS